MKLMSVCLLVLLIGIELASSAYIPRSLALLQKRNLVGLQKLKRDWVKDPCNKPCSSRADCCEDYKCSFYGSFIRDFKEGVCEVDCNPGDLPGKGELCEKCYDCQQGLMCTFSHKNEWICDDEYAMLR